MHHNSMVCPEEDNKSETFPCYNGNLHLTSKVEWQKVVSTEAISAAIW
ncbi:hypothetical protein T06_10563 [Trichinella sp. T6]|nr:hypothetical protein T06_10563 [Trichinella sp. T6]